MAGSARAAASTRRRGFTSVTAAMTVSPCRMRRNASRIFERLWPEFRRDGEGGTVDHQKATRAGDMIARRFGEVCPPEAGDGERARVAHVDLHVAAVDLVHLLAREPHGLEPHGVMRPRNPPKEWPRGKPLSAPLPFHLTSPRALPRL